MIYFQKEKRITLKEYGKTVQKMVDLAVQEPDRARRTAMAFAIVEIMSKISPLSKQTESYVQKLWDHLFFISDFKLDVDSPYPMVARELIVPKADKFHYPLRLNKHRHYGKYVVEFIDKAVEMEESKKNIVAHSLASYMKLVHKNWNNEVVNDEIVKNDLNIISKGKLEMPEDESIKQLVSGWNNNLTNSNKSKGKFNFKNNKQKIGHSKFTKKSSSTK